MSVKSHVTEKKSAARFYPPQKRLCDRQVEKRHEFGEGKSYSNADAGGIPASNAEMILLSGA